MTQGKEKAALIPQPIRWSLASAEEIEDKELLMFPPVRKTLMPLAVFCYLRKNYGGPNLPSFEGLPWAWALSCDAGTLAVYGMGDMVQLGYLGQSKEKPTEQLKSEIVQLLGELEKASERTPKAGEAVGGVVVNPFRRYAEMATALTEVAREKGATEKQTEDSGEKQSNWPDQPETSVDQAKLYFEDLRGIRRARDGALLGAFLAHVLSLEAFLNLIYHLFLRSDLTDERMRTYVERQDLDVKLRLLGIFCTCFETDPIKPNDEEYKAFAYLTEVRKNLAHAKLTPAMQTAIILEEERYPFYISTPAQTKYGISADASSLTVDMVQKAGGIVWAVVSKIMRSMKADMRMEFLVAHFDQRITYTRSDAGETRIIVDADELRAASEIASEFLETTVDWAKVASNN